MSGFPVELLYLLALLGTILVVFVLLRRPIYEAMFVGFIVMLVMLGKLDEFWKYLIRPSTNTLFYAIVAFLSLAYIFGKTQVVTRIIEIILSLVGRFRGGAGYVALLSSTFMASLSGTGPGNVAATGVFTIPAMIRTKFPPALAATVEMSASSLGPMIPPSGTILLAYGILDALYPGTYALSNFWMVVWGIGLWFVVQRILTLYLFCRYYKVVPVPTEEIPDTKEALKKGWKALLVPVIIFLPLYVDFKFGSTFLTERLGKAGASAFSSSVILFTPGVAALYTLLISAREAKVRLTPVSLFQWFRTGMRQIAPVAATVYFAYCISHVFGDAKVGAALGDYIHQLSLTKAQLILFIPLLTMFLGMFLPGSSQIAIFGVGIVGGLIAVGVHPLLAAAILPAITGAMEGMTPPMALAMYAAMGIAQSDMWETSKLAYVWIGVHLAASILVLAGWLPVWLQ